MNKFKSLISAHGGDVGETLNDLIKEWNKEHGDGNPTYKITDFQQEDFLCTPALSREPAVIRAYLEKICEYMKERFKTIYNMEF